MQTELVEQDRPPSLHTQPDHKQRKTESIQVQKSKTGLDLIAARELDEKGGRARGGIIGLGGIDCGVFEVCGGLGGDIDGGIGGNEGGITGG
ncbi:hypothetical protein RIR_jg7493.t1 [Rhizophagus irregularis DAOM 181602=DAOM 197198]|nr:hypothetical protein RIR_jg7493.t1 [Rhizophagus irregularis DAOM 181602=DAOM 197198]CAB4378019.1 unnamed protein product [Rhizophagus irregularis]